MLPDEKILSRIRKLLSMASDTSSPQEAAIAAGRARKLMDAHQVSELDLSTTSASDFGSEAARTGLKTSPSYLGVLAVSCAWLNDAQVHTMREDGLTYYQFDGFLSDTICAVEMFKYLRRTADDFTKILKLKSAARKSFLAGFASGVQQQVREILTARNTIHTSSGTALVAAKKSLVAAHFGAPSYRTSRNAPKDVNFYHAGREAGKTTGLSRQVGGGTRRLPHSGNG